MFAALNASPAVTGIVSLPYLGTLAVATAILVGIAVHLRGLRTTGTLTLAAGSISGASAALVLAVALLLAVAFGPSAPAVAHDSPTATHIVKNEPALYQPVDIEGLEGYQLPTE